MKTKTFILASLFLASGITSAQITPSMTIPNPLPNYDGSYDGFGTNHLYYPNDGEIRFANTDKTSAKEVVKFYTMNTYPKKYLLNNNNLSYLHVKSKGTLTGSDTLQRIDLEWQGSNSSAFLARVDTQNFAKLNYFTQWFGSGGRTDVKGGAAIACQSIYSNIDLVYTSNNSGIVIYFIVYPGGNFNSIRLNVNGSTSNSIGSNKLKIGAFWESSSLERPQMYQYALSGSVITPVNVGTADWQNIGTNLYKIASTSSYNNSLPLIIQIKQADAAQFDTPGLDWSTYFGGAGQDYLIKTHADASDNIYAAGFSQSPSISFPQGNGVALDPNNGGDAAIAKFNTVGILQWTSFVGGSGVDVFHDFTFKGDSIYCVGKTSSNNIQTVPKSGATNNNTFGGGYDAFICELVFNPMTSNVQKNWLTYVGGNGDEEYNACKFDGSGNLFCVGAGSSTNMTVSGTGLGAYTQTFSASQLAVNPLSSDGIIASYNNAGLQTWFTFYGTSTLGVNAYNHAADHLYDLAINGTDLYVCGEAGGTNLPNGWNTKTNINYYGGFLAHFTTSGSLFLNGATWTRGNACNFAIETHGGEVYLVGQATSTMSTLNSGLHYYDGTLDGASDASIIVYDNSGASVQHCTYFGGNSDDAALDLEFTTNGLMLVAGGTDSFNNFPNTSLGSMYYATNPTNAQDNFIAAFQKGNITPVWCSNLGSSSYESYFMTIAFNHEQQAVNTAITLDSQNALYIAGCTFEATDFPLDEWYSNVSYFQPQISSPADATMTRIVVTDLNSYVGIEDFKNTQFVFGIYPNPTNKYISITNTELSANDLQFIVYDMNGKKLMVGELTSNEDKNIDVSSLPQGVYIINVSNGVKTFSNKFVKSGN